MVCVCIFNLEPLYGLVCYIVDTYDFMGLGMSDGQESGHDDNRWKIVNFSKVLILGIQSDLKEARG